MLPYSIGPAPAKALLMLVASSFRVRLFGVPPLPGDTAADIARAALRQNAGSTLIAGAGHFRFMWVSDFAKALRGAASALPGEYLDEQVRLMTRLSAAAGRVPTCFSTTKAFDVPYYRADGLPWLIFCAAERPRAADLPALQKLLDGYEREHFEDGLISTSQRGDWMDTIRRPSSTYNNILALEMLRAARGLGLETRHEPGEFERRLLESRWRGDHFIDYHGTEDASVDAAVYALYLGLFPRDVREKAADWLEASGLAEPLPILSAPRDYDKRLMPVLTRLTPGYHSVVWLHLGLAYLNGLKKLGRDVSARRKRVEDLFVRHHNIIETVRRDGSLYETPFHSTEHALTMAAGQCLELAA
jgi:hypothetical protein